MKKLIIFLVAVLVFNMSVCCVQVGALSTVYFNYPFTDNTPGVKPSGIGITTKADCNTVAVVADGGLDGNCMQIAKNGVDGDPYFDISVSNYYNEAPAVLKFSFITPDTAATKHITVRAVQDDVASFHQLVRFSAGGDLVVGTKTVGTYKANVRYDCAIVLGSSDKSTLSFYMTYEGKTDSYENISFNNWGSKKFNLIRFQMSANYIGSIYFDNLCMYVGDEVLDSSGLETARPAKIIPEEAVESWLSGCAVFSEDSTNAYFGGKQTAEHSAVVNGEKVYIPAVFTADAFGGTLSESSDGKTVTVTSDSGSADFALDDGYISSDNCILLEADKLSALFGKKAVYNEKYGITIVDSTDSEWDDAEIKAVYDYMTYARPTAEQILKDFEPMKNVHPRILATGETFESIKQSIQTDSRMRQWYSSVIYSAENILSAAVTEYVKDNRSTILDKSRQVLTRAKDLGFAYRMTGDSRYAERLWLELEAACGFEDWNHSRHFLDTAEMTTAVAIGYDWCYDYWNDEQKALLEEGIVKHGLNAGMLAYEGASDVNRGWVSATHNWNEVCNGGLSVGALALLDVESELCSKILELAFLSCESMLGEFAPDGGWGEGITYWAYTVNYLAYHMSSLDAALGTDYGYTNARGIRSTGYFVTAGQSAQGKFNFHDAGDSMQNSASVFYLASKLGDDNLTNVRLHEMESYNLNGGVLDLLWYTPSDSDSGMNMNYDMLFRDTETATFRSAYGDSSALFAGLHGGYNLVNHGNLDAGTFVIDALGERWASDLGSEEYSLSGYFDSTKRWNYYRCNAQGQNVIAMNPITENGQETGGFATFESFETSERGGFGVLDMTSVYGDKVTYAKRGMKVDSNRSQILVQDEMNLTSATDLWWFMHTKADIEIASDGKSAILTIGEKQMKVFLYSNHADAVFEEYAAEPLEGSVNPDGQTSNSDFTRLTVHLSDAAGEVNISVRFVPLSAGVTADSAVYGEYIPLDSWQNTAGTMAALTSLEIDGASLGEFSPEKTSYSIYLPYGTKTVPYMSVAAAEGFAAEVTQAAAIRQSAQIKVYDAAEPENYRIYQINFPVRSTVTESTCDDFESYSDAESLSTKIWSTSQVLSKAGPHLVRTGAGYDGKISKSFGIVIPADADSGADPALVTKAMNFMHPMKIRFDVMADSMDSKINLVLREGYTPNWFHPLSKAAGTSKATVFGLPLDGFEMAENEWYRFEYEIYADTESEVIHFNLSINGEPMMLGGSLPYYCNADFQSVSVKFAHTAPATAVDSATVYWDNISVERTEFMFTDVSFKKGKEALTTAAGLKKDDEVSADINAVYEGEDAVKLALALYEKDGALKYIDIKTLTAAELASGEKPVGFTLDADSGDSAFIKLFAWNSASLKPLAAVQKK